METSNVEQPQRKAKLAPGARGKMKDGIRQRVKRDGQVIFEIKVAARDENGKPSAKWYSYATRAEAKEHRDKLRSMHHTRPLIAIPRRSQMTLSAYLDGYIASREIEPTTRITYRNRLRHWQRLPIGKLRLSEITFAQIEQAKDQLNHLAPATKASVFVALRTALKRAVGKYLRADPTDQVEMPRPPDAERVHAPSPEDIAELLRNLSGHETWLPATVMAYTGMRRGEVCALRRSCLDLERGEIHVRGTVQRVERELLLAAPKTANSERTVAITPDLVQALRAHLAEQDRAAHELGMTPSPEWFAFPAYRGRWNPTAPRDPSALAASMKYALAKTRFADFSPHDFRHAHATALLSAGVNPKAVAARIGDTVGVLMQTYAHLLRGDAEQVATVFAREVAKSSKSALPGAPREPADNVKYLNRKTSYRI